MNMENRYFLEIVDGTPQSGRFALFDGEHLVGRHETADIRIGDESKIVSKRHALLIVKNHSVVVRDCASVNHTFVNGGQITESALSEGDILGLGENGPRLRLVKAGPEKISGPLDGAAADRTRIQPAASRALHAAGMEKSPEASPTPGVEIGGREFPSDVIPSTKEIGRMVMGRGLLRQTEPAQALSTSQELLLSKAAKAYRKKRGATYGIAGIIIAGLLCLAAYYARGYYRYESMVSEGKKLLLETSDFDRQYELLREKDTAFSESKQKLLGQILDRQRQLESVVSKLPLQYRGRFFTDSTERYLCDIMAEFHEPFYSVPPHVLGLVKSHVERFTGEQKRHSEILMRRKDRYFPYIEHKFQTERLPMVLAYMAMQESGLDPRARSPRDAVGLWQFTRETGERYGLKITPDIDEREDWQKSTDAAARYLHDLLAFFGEGRGVLLAIAAYNTGEPKVRGALRRIKDPLRERDFWHLYRTSNALAQETREYVPQILARIIVDRHRGVYGMRPEGEGAGGK